MGLHTRLLRITFGLIFLFFGIGKFMGRLTNFVGGMNQHFAGKLPAFMVHLRGFGRQMGGLYVTIFNWLEGPPAFAPALFTGFAAVGLMAIYFL